MSFDDLRSAPAVPLYEPCITAPFGVAAKAAGRVVVPRAYVYLLNRPETVPSFFKFLGQDVAKFADIFEELVKSHIFYLRQIKTILNGLEGKIDGIQANAVFYEKAKQILRESLPVVRHDLNSAPQPYEHKPSQTPFEDFLDTCDRIGMPIIREMAGPQFALPTPATLTGSSTSPLQVESPPQPA